MAVSIPEQAESNLFESILGEKNEEPHNLFADDEPDVWGETESEESEGEISDEGETDDEEEDSVEEAEEDDGEAEDDEAEEDEEDSDSKVAANLKKALHAERTKRKEAAEARDQMQAILQDKVSEASSVRSAYEKLVASIKEHGLEDLVEVPKLEDTSPEVLEARKLKQQQEEQKLVSDFYDFVRTEATSLAPDFANVDLSDDAQGIALTQIITAAVVNGVERDAAVSEGLKVLNTVIANAKKSALKNRQPAVKPKTKPKARTKQASPSSRSEAIRKGDFDSIFASMGKAMAKGD